MAVLVTSLAALVIIGAARRKILVSKPPGLSSSSPSLFSGGAFSKPAALSITLSDREHGPSWEVTHWWHLQLSRRNEIIRS